MEKLLVICGPTATGKTSLAIELALVLGGELVSADSRQVYRRMDIGTGKDLPVISDFQFPISSLKKDGIGCYIVDGVRMWGYDLVEPTEEFSVFFYTKIARRIICDIWKRGKLPILVGGTGFYIKGVVDGIGTSNIPINKGLRVSLEGKNKDELFEILRGVDPIRAASLNVSDRKNPRRLVRAIEIASERAEIKGEMGCEERSGSFAENYKKNISVYIVGLKAPKEFLDKRIEERVKKRLKQGFGPEIMKLIGEGVSWDDQSMQALGYRQWRRYYEGKATEDKAVLEWIRKEKDYARRQMTWFKRDRRINWFDVAGRGWRVCVEKEIQKWHNLD